MKKVSRIVVLALLAFSLPQKKKIKMYMIGDSTMCQYDIKRVPLTGWGIPFKNYFDSCVVIDNRAGGGTSTRTSISENRWQPIVENLNEGDYVLIQFGHNDEAKEKKYKNRYMPVPELEISTANGKKVCV